MDTKAKKFKEFPILNFQTFVKKKKRNERIYTDHLYIA